MVAELLPFCLVMAGLFSAVLIIAGASKYLEIRRARNWAHTTGTITKSKIHSRRREAADGDSFESEPLIKYEYRVAGSDYSATRVNFAEEIGDEEIAPMLKKYPVGKIVRVYYNPSDPNESVLESNFPSNTFKILGVVVFVILLLGVILPYSFDAVSHWVASIAPNANGAAPATLLFAMGLFTLLIAYASQRQVWATRDWSIANGKVLDTRVEARGQWDSEVKHRTYYDSSIVYSFSVRDQQYISHRVTFGGKFSGTVLGGVPGFVQSRLEKYPAGSNVQVYYNPSNPSDCVLERRASGLWFLVFIASALLGGAALIAGFIRL